jgi:hypothetical protein
MAAAALSVTTNASRDAHFTDIVLPCPACKRQTLVQCEDNPRAWKCTHMTFGKPRRTCVRIWTEAYFIEPNGVITPESRGLINAGLVTEVDLRLALGFSPTMEDKRQW